MSLSRPLFSRQTSTPRPSRGVRGRRCGAGTLPGDFAKHAEIEHMFDYLVSWYVTRDMWRVVCDGPSGLMRPRAGEGGAGHGDGCGAG